MVKLNNWDDIVKPLFRRHMPTIISAREMLVFRKLEQVFSGMDRDGEVHQCFCGDIFYLSKEIKEKVPKDWLGNPYVRNVETLRKHMRIGNGRACSPQNPCIYDYLQSQSSFPEASAAL